MYSADDTMYQAYGVTEDGEVSDLIVDNHGEFPEEEVTNGITRLSIYLYGDDPSSVFVEAYGFDLANVRKAVERALAVDLGSVFGD